MAKQFMEPLQGGAAWIHGELAASSTATDGHLVMGEGWMLEMVRFEDRERTIGLFLDAFGIINFDIPEFRESDCTFVGFSAPGKPPLSWLQSSTLFEMGDVPLAKTPESLLRRFQKSLPRRNIDVAAGASALSKRLKRRISETYRGDTSLATLARDLGVSHAHATRQFKRDFGFTPIHYKHQLRVSDATSRLFRGGDILEVGHDVGFNDTSRFYHDFRKITRAPPGKCRL